MKNLITLCFLSWSLDSWSHPAQYYSIGRQTNASANTVLADTGDLSCPGTIGCNYKIGIILNGSGGMTYKLETMDTGDNIVNTIYLSAPAGDAKVITPETNFFIPNGYQTRVRNDSSLLLGGTLQASIILEVKELN